MLHNSSDYKSHKLSYCHLFGESSARLLSHPSHLTFGLFGRVDDVAQVIFLGHGLHDASHVSPTVPVDYHCRNLNEIFHVKSVN